MDEEPIVVRVPGGPSLEARLGSVEAARGGFAARGREAKKDRCGPPIWLSGSGTLAGKSLRARVTV
jgi:hypothetical protein